MIRRLLTRLWSIDWTGPYTNTGGNPMLERHLDEQRIRADERHTVLSQSNTAHGQPPRCLPGKAHP